jgi:hypothetical protein
MTVETEAAEIDELGEAAIEATLELARAEEVERATATPLAPPPAARAPAIPEAASSCPRACGPPRNSTTA